MKKGAEMKTLVLNAVGREFDFENVDISTPTGRELAPWLNLKEIS